MFFRPRRSPTSESALASIDPSDGVNTPLDGVAPRDAFHCCDLRRQAEALAASFPPLMVAAAQTAATTAQGVHGRRRVGTGETFWQFRRYQPGDSITRIDWRQSARSTSVYVRETEWEAAQSLWLWRDASPSMTYRSHPRLPTKRQRADVLLLALAALLVRAGERVAFLSPGFRPDNGRHVLDRLTAILQKATTHSNEQRDSIFQSLPRAAHVVLIGDFLDSPEPLKAQLATLANRRIRGYALQILDPAEETLAFEGRALFQGLEGEGRLLVPRVEAIRSAYQERLATHRAQLHALFRAAGWGFVCHHTDCPPKEALLKLYAMLSEPSFL
ncbi:DUF58 domain-containing protein [Azospirillaceae bacterium]